MIREWKWKNFVGIKPWLRPTSLGTVQFFYVVRCPAGAGCLVCTSYLRSLGIRLILELIMLSENVRPYIEIILVASNITVRLRVLWSSNMDLKWLDWHYIPQIKERLTIIPSISCKTKVQLLYAVWYSSRHSDAPTSSWVKHNWYSSDWLSVQVREFSPCTLYGNVGCY